jgi:hypothetical protein
MKRLGRLLISSGLFILQSVDPSCTALGRKTIDREALVQRHFPGFSERIRSVRLHWATGNSHTLWMLPVCRFSLIIMRRAFPLRRSRNGGGIALPTHTIMSLKMPCRIGIAMCIRCPMHLRNLHRRDSGCVPIRTDCIWAGLACALRIPEEKILR